MVSLNGTTVHEQKGTDFVSFAKSAYKKFDIDYSKFFKMDNLSKLAFLAADLLLKDDNIKEKQNIALVFSNRAASLDTDRRHQESISKNDSYFPSPAVFVYTLPNICMGEISIKHKLHSENAFFIFEKFNAQYLHTYTESLILEKKAEKVLCGWTELDGEKYKAFLYVVGKSGIFTHSTHQITRLYQNK
ncbi:3-oxoacyl-ACP synthase [Maribacter algicola]|uniref:3-oxoacyl-ACP synthase n=1 Tax=Meishania litoralis TaxID=3434685 RepID=A0ACC7LLA6_9FLAO